MSDDDLCTIWLLARETGKSEPSIRWLIQSGEWVEGQHYYRRRRRIMLVRKACLDWYREGDRGPLAKNGRGG